MLLYVLHAVAVLVMALCAVVLCAFVLRFSASQTVILVYKALAHCRCHVYALPLRIVRNCSVLRSLAI